MKKLFVSLTAIFITASFALGQEKPENLSKQTGNGDKGAAITVNKAGDIKLKTLSVESSSAAQNSTILPRAVELNNQGIRLTIEKDYQNALELFKQADSLARETNRYCLI